MELYNDIRTIEENALKKGHFSNVSLTEIHTVEAIGMYETRSMSEVAKILGITTGTLTVAVNKLVKKQYVQRIKSDRDRRVVLLKLTKEGRLLYRVHQKFHIDLIRASVEGVSEEERETLERALERLHAYMMENYIND
ncbi:MAG: MarR family transcriptional regulator [Clostridiales bacterium]|nr:MarR family transcriptional regulator [Clostridiales bacterium]